MKRYLLKDKTRAAFGENIFNQLSADLGISTRALHTAVQFSWIYPDIKSIKPISWNHYRILITIENEAERRRWEEKILKEQLAYLPFLELRRAGRQVEKRPTDIKKEIERGQLYVYRLRRIKYAQSQADQLVVDCGFDITAEVPLGRVKFQGGDLVESVKTDDTYKVKHAQISPSRLYTYKAFVERVIDGDTVLVHIDAGFGIWVRQSLRMRSIDAPEAGTNAGERVKNFTKDKLKDLAFVVVKTYGSDKYDRYLVDIFYLPSGAPGAADPQSVADHGRLLNQELIDEGLAERWQ